MEVAQPNVEPLFNTPRALEMIERVGRQCYNSTDKIGPGTAGPFVRKLITKGHEAPLEHACFSFLITTDRGVTHELVRHRIAAYCQESTRYCNYGGGIAIMDNPELPLKWQERAFKAMRAVEELYTDMVADDVLPQVARHYLPIGLRTRIIATTNARQWRHVLRQRLFRAAHPHIRAIMRDILLWFSAAYPVLVEDLKVSGQ